MDYCKSNGEERSDWEKQVWNEFMIKRGWRDLPPDSENFQEYKEMYGYGERQDIETYFEFFEVDEGRKP